MSGQTRRVAARQGRLAVAAVTLFALAACTSGPNETAGAVLGGAAGGIAGAQIGSGSGQLVATGVGAGLGALAGSSLGRGLDRQAQPTRTSSYAAPTRTSAYYAPARGAYVHDGYARRYAPSAPAYRPRGGGYDTPVVDVHRQVAIPGAEQADDIGFFDFLVPPATPHYPPALQRTAAPAGDPNCRRSDRPTVKPVYVCTQGGASYVVQ